MSDETTPEQTAPHSDSAPEQQPSRWSRLRSRVCAVGRRAGRGTVIGLVAGLVIGGAGGFAVAAVATGPERGHRISEHGRPFEGDGRGVAPPAGGPRGELPPGTSPELDQAQPDAAPGPQT